MSVLSGTALHPAFPMVPQNCVFYDSATRISEHCPDSSVACNEKLKKMGRCFVCRGTRQIAELCKTKCVTRPLCSCLHHQSVCEQSEVKPEISSLSTDTVVSSVSSTVNIKSKEPNAVLLQTAKAWTEGPGGRSIVLCLIDRGSQQGFVHEKLVWVLQLPVLRLETLNLHSFGSPNSVKRNTVKMTLGTHNRKLRLKLLRPHKCPQVSLSCLMVKFKDWWRMVVVNDNNLQLVVFPLQDADLELVVLTRTDFYWEVVSGKLEKLSDFFELPSQRCWPEPPSIVSNSSETETTCMS